MGLAQWDRAPRPEELRGGGREHSTLQRGVGCKYFTSPVQSHEATEIRAGHRVCPEQEGIGIKALAGAWPGHHPGSAAGCCPQGGLAGLGTVCALHQPSCPGMAPPARSWGPRGAAARVPSPTQRPRVLEAVPWHGWGKGPPPAPLLPLAPTHPIPERWQLPGAQTGCQGAQGGTEPAELGAAVPRGAALPPSPLLLPPIKWNNSVVWASRRLLLEALRSVAAPSCSLVPRSSLAQTEGLAPGHGLCFRTLSTVPWRAVRLGGAGDCPAVPQSRAEGQGKHPECQQLALPGPTRGWEVAPATPRSHSSTPTGSATWGLLYWGPCFLGAPPRSGGGYSSPSYPTAIPEPQHSPPGLGSVESSPLKHPPAPGMLPRGSEQSLALH